MLADIEETRDGIEKLLNADGYRVDPARNEREAVKGRRQHPDLILVSGGGFGIDTIAVVSRIRDFAELGQEVPVVIFCVDSVAEGAEVQIGKSIYMRSVQITATSSELSSEGFSISHLPCCSHLLCNSRDLI